MLGFFSPGKVFIFISQNSKTLEGWTSLATIGNILEEDTIPNEVLSSQRAFYWRGEIFVGLLLLHSYFYRCDCCLSSYHLSSSLCLYKINDV